MENKQKTLINKCNENESLNKDDNNNNLEDTQYYLITLEDNKGGHQQIKIFKNSDPSEIAFNFCKENNLDFKSMKYIQKNIQKIIEQFDEPNHKLFFLDNSYSSIQEVDEENLCSENTLKSKNSTLVNENNIKEKIRINNKDKINNMNYENIEKNENINNLNIKQNKNEDKNKDNNEKNGINIQNKIKMNNKENNNKDINDKIATKNKNFYINEYIKNNKNIILNNIKIDKNNKNKNDDIHSKMNNDDKENNSLNNYNKDNKESINGKVNIKDNIIKEYIKDKKEETTNIDSNKNIYKNKNNNENNNIQYNNNIIQNNNRNGGIYIRIKNNIKKNPNEKNNLFEYQNKTPYNDEQIKMKNKVNEENKEKNNEIQNNIKINNYIIDKKDENKNTIDNLFKIKKEFITNIINKNILTDRTITNNINNNKKIKLQNLMPKSFKYIKLKQHLINEEYKNLLKKESNTYNTNREKENIIENYLKQANKDKSDKNINSKIRQILRTNKEVYDNTLSNTFINNNPKKNNNQFPKNIHNTQIKDKSLNLNKKTKNKLIIKRNKRNLFENKDITKFSCDMSKFNEMAPNNEKIMRTFEGESGSKTKRISEMRNGVNKMFNNILGQKNNILNTNYIVNKRCRIINNKNKKNMSMNLSRYFIDYNQKKNKSPKYNLEINTSKNNYDNLNIKDYIISRNHNLIYNKNKNILSNNNNYNSSKKNYFILLNSQKQPVIHRYNTNIKNSRILNTISSYPKKRKKIIFSNRIKNNKKSNSNSSLKKRKFIISKFKDIKNNNINSSNSLLINSQNTLPMNDYCLKILDQYYTINNTINITNNNSLISNFSNNMSHKKTDTNDKFNNLKNIIRDIFKFFDKDKNGFIIINNKIKFNINKNNLAINFDFFKILEKMMKILYEIKKKSNSIDFDEDNIIINENNFIKYMIYIYNNKLNFYEKKVFYSSNINNTNRIIKKDFIQYNCSPKSSFNRYKENKNIFSSYNSLSKLNNKREIKIIGNNDINKLLFYKIKKNENKKKLRFNSFSDL